MREQTREQATSRDSGRLPEAWIPGVVVVLFMEGGELKLVWREMVALCGTHCV